MPIDALFKGNGSVELHERLVDWFLNSEDNDEAFSQWAALNIKPDTAKPGKEEMEKFRRLAKVLNIKHDVGSKAPARRFFEGGLATRVAAVLVPVLIAVDAALLIFDNRGREATVEFYDVTQVVLQATGESEEFALPDGTKVTLRGSSKLRYPSDFPTERTVELDGEALFDVTRNEKHPFTVHSEQLSVVVLGTKFKVTASRDAPEAEIVLLSGSVAVELGTASHRLTPGHRMTLDRETLSVVGQEELSAGEMARLSGSDLEIDNTSATDALRVVADYYGKSLTVTGKLPVEYRWSIVLPHRMSPEEAMEVLNRLSDDERFEIMGDAIHVYR